MSNRASAPPPSYRLERLLSGGAIHGLGLDGRVTGPGGYWGRPEAQLFAEVRRVNRALANVRPNRRRRHWP